MDPILLADLPAILGAEAVAPPAVGRVATVCIDSRAVGYESLFFALPGARTDGHRHVEAALAGGAAAAVVSRAWLAERGGRVPGACLVVESPLVALQRLAGWWRRKLAGRLLAITGSNGKTIAKDALVHLLSGRHRTAGSVGSYNSQLGVPLALLRLPAEAEVAVVEAGVSAPGEMAPLEAVLRPDAGLLTNIGLAHIGSFGSRQAIAGEKLVLFAGIPSTGFVVLPAGEPLVGEAAEKLSARVVRYGAPSDEVPWIARAESRAAGYRVDLRFPSGERLEVQTAAPSLEILADLDAALAAAWLLGLGAEPLATALESLRPAHTRLEIWRAPAGGVTVIDDACSSDPVSVKAALATLETVAGEGGRRVFVFGGMRDLGPLAAAEHRSVGLLAAAHRVDLLALVGGDELEPVAAAFTGARPAGRVGRFARVEEVQEPRALDLQPGDTVLVKGPRGAGIERAAQGLIEAMAPNRLVLDLAALGANVQTLRRLVGPHRQLLGMVKALAYGSDLTRVGVELQNLGLDALGVSTVDEGAILRRAGVDLPILVMLPTAPEADKLVRHGLTPVVYSPDLVDPLGAAARRAGRELSVHLEVDTGLGRLGVFPRDLETLAERVAAAGQLRVVGVMTHMGAAEDPGEDDYTRRQLAEFDACVARLEARGFRGLIRHAAATAAAVRFPESRYDLVRIGLGLYGVYPSEAVAEGLSLELAVSLLSRVSEVRDFPAGFRIGYGGTYRVGPGGMRGAVLPIGYHDGVPRELTGRGVVYIAGKPAPIVGRISMDSMMVDASGVPDVREGSDALLFGARDGVVARPEALAAAAGTIGHELLARIGPRVQRVCLR